MTRNEALSHLTAMYTVAVQTGTVSSERQYVYFADTLHKAIRGLMIGNDPEAEVAGVAKLWRDEANMIPVEGLTALNRSWANMADGTNPEGTI